MNPNESPNSKPVWPGRKIALRRLAIIALVLFPCTWIADALLVRNWNILENHDAEAFRHLREAGAIFVGFVCVAFLLTLLPGVHGFFRRLFNWRVIRRDLIACAWLVTLIALFYGEQDWQGRHAWNKYSAQLKAEGDELDFKAFIPPPIPDSENFAAIPEIQSWFVRNTNGLPWFQSEWDTNIVTRARVKSRSESDKIPWRMTDLAEWQAAFEDLQAGRAPLPNEVAVTAQDPASRAKAAREVLNALKPMDGALEELRQAASRPRSRYPVVYSLENPWGIMLPHLQNIREICNYLELSACAELAVGENDKALDDVKLILRMGDSLEEEPFLISYMLRGAAIRSAAQPIWEGLADHRWSDGQLKELQTLMGKYHFIADLKTSLECERSAGILTADLLGRGKTTLSDLHFASIPAISVMIPRGWYDFEKVNYCRLFNLQTQGVFDITNGTVSLARIGTQITTLQATLGNQSLFTTICIRHELLSRLLLPALSAVSLRGALAQVTADEAAIACALERYRLAHGQYPDKLDALQPNFIAEFPHDTITGDPYKYRLKANKEFVLYSVGQNGKDDGGKLARKGDTLNIYSDDWVWEYPAR